ncbi:MAG: hypothetical protein K0R31_272 [Clostridiales bacterium]|jgi:hypothetical protein|nr:hypothetical protein [Clostridiales bacterium]
MDLNILQSFLGFLGNSFLFSFIITLVGFILGWLLYDYVVTPRISLRDALFERDNPAAWVEFIGAFIYPTLYLAAKAIEGSASDVWWLDLLICTGYVIGYVILLTVLRLFSGLIVRFFNIKDEGGKISLNNEIYQQKNISAAIFSVALSNIFVTMIRFIDIDPEFYLNSLLTAASVLILTLLAVIVYLLVLGRKTTLFKEVFIDNNIAAGAAFLGFIFAIENLFSNAIIIHRGYNFLEIIGVTFISLAVFGVLSALFKKLFTKLIKVDLMVEIYEQNNIGAAIGQIALYVGISNVIIHFMK